MHLSIHEGSNWIISVDTIREIMFDGSKAFLARENRIDKDSLLKANFVKFPNRIIVKDSCLILKGNDKDIKVCRHRSGNEREWTGYDAHDFVNGYLVVMKSAYESSDFISFNPVTRKYFHTSNEPVFISKEMVYAYGNDHGEGQFQIIDIGRNRHFGFDAFGWQLTRFYKEGTIFYMELVSNHGLKTTKYLKLDYMEQDKGVKKKVK